MNTRATKEEHRRDNTEKTQEEKTHCENTGGDKVVGEGGGGSDSRRCSVLERTCRSRQTEALREWGRRRERHETASWTSVSCQMVLRVSSRPPPLPVPGHCETHRSPEASPTCAENTETALARSREEAHQLPSHGRVRVTTNGTPSYSPKGC